MFREVVLLITAAGCSSRMGKAKGTVEIGDKELLQIHIENFNKAFPDSPIFLVIGHHITEYQHYGDQVRFIENSNYRQGQFSSIKVGLEGIPQVKHSQVLLQPVDLAPVPSEVYTKLVAVPPQKEVVKPQHNCQSGHPILLRGEVLNTILSASSDHRLDKILKTRPLQTIEWVHFSTCNISTNLNSPEELSKYLKDNL